MPKPDNRLANLTNGEYRLWYDGHQVLIPVGQSTTKPLTKELVGVNVKVSGNIEKSYFKPALAEFKNNLITNDVFDSFYLSNYRRFDMIPTHEAGLDLHNDVGLDYLIFDVDLIAGVNFDDIGGVVGYYKGLIRLNYVADGTWMTDPLPIVGDDIAEVQGSIILGTSTFWNMTTQNGLIIGLNRELQKDTLYLNAEVLSLRGLIGSSEINLLTSPWRNEVDIDILSLELVGGGL